MVGQHTVARQGLIDPADAPDVAVFLARLVRLDPAALVRLRRDPQGRGRLWGRLPFDVLVCRGLRPAGGVAAAPVTAPDDAPVTAPAVEPDATYRAADLARVVNVAAGEAREATGGGAEPGSPPRRDVEWRWSLPPGRALEVERLPAHVLHRVGAAAASTVRVAAAQGVAGRAVGERALRDALLDHVPIVVTTDGGDEIRVSQRLVQAVIRMGFLPTPDPTADPTTDPTPDPTADPTADPAVGATDDGVNRDETSVVVLSSGRWVALAAQYGTAWHRQGPI